MIKEENDDLICKEQIDSIENEIHSNNYQLFPNIAM